MRSRTKKLLLSVLAVNVASAVVGAGTAATVASPSIPPASATHRCTHYTPDYFTGDTASQPHLCYAYKNVQAAEIHTDGIAIRDQNSVSYRDGAYGWQLWYANQDLSYFCCQAVGTSGYHAIGGSLGASKRAGCKLLVEGAAVYCTTLF